MLRAPFFVITVMAASVVALTAADAQEANPNVSVGDRERDFSPKGLPAGAYRIFPSLEVGGAYDDNVFATKDNEEDDFFAVISPNIVAQSEFVRHSLNFEAGAEYAYYDSTSGNDYTDWFVGSSGNLDIRRNSNLFGRVRFGRTHEDRDSPDDQDPDEDITKINGITLNLGLRQGFNRFFVEPSLRYTILDFRGSRNNDRDRSTANPRLRLGYELTPRVNLFTEGGARLVSYEESRDDQGFEQDSTGYNAVVGAEVDVTAVLFGEVSAGYESTDYDDDEFDDTDGLQAAGSLTWNVTELTSIIGSVESGVQESTVVFEGERASGSLSTSGDVRVEHELLRNLDLNGSVGIERDDFEGTGRTDDTFRAGVGFSYSFSRNFSFNGSYRFSTRDSDEDDEEFTRNVVFLGVRAAL